MSVFWSRIQSGRVAVVKLRPNSIWLPYVFSTAYNRANVLRHLPAQRRTNTQVGRKVRMIKKIKMRRGEWMNKSTCWVRTLLSARGCSSHTSSVFHSAGVRVCVSDKTRFFHPEACWVENTEGKLTRNCFFFSHTSAKHVPSMRGSGGYNCRAAVLSGGGCHLESGWLSNGH